MNKSLSILLILALFASVLAENCADHPWAKKDKLKKFKSRLVVPDTNTDWTNVINIFNKDSTATDEHTLSTTDYPGIP